jgi:predicted NodU family carbamoyl transferase
MQWELLDGSLLRRICALPEVWHSIASLMNMRFAGRGSETSTSCRMLAIPGRLWAVPSMVRTCIGLTEVAGEFKSIRLALHTQNRTVSSLQKAHLKPELPLDLPATVAMLLAGGLIVGWFQGGSEYGPRALGSRSILADGRPAGIKDYLNQHVKHRESFRPYAPAVLEERVSEWFDLEGSSPFMLRVVDVRPEKRSTLAGVTHVDGTARVQTVNRRDNGSLYDVIRAFELQTGVPVILNTSFNLAGEPIVETPDDAIKCFLATGIDVLVIGQFLVQKEPSDPGVKRLVTVM